VDVAPFLLDRTPVTNAAYRRFVEAGGYRDPALWTPIGWAWRDAAGLEAPQFWSPDLDRVLRFGSWRPIDPREPVQHVGFHEAQAYARWAGRRLPTEVEWEVAATIAPDGTKRRFPWGDEPATPDRANLGQRHDGPLPADALPAGANPWGVLGLVGDVWEWTSSTFAPYPGFVSFPYREYSEVFFGTGEGDDGYRVLRGGSWAADPVAVRGTFRNWDHPIRRQIFSGFRCARDIDEAGP
jgi:iron(II)-dependent oxidoreductase